MIIRKIGDALVSIRGVLEVLTLRDGECTIRHADTEDEVDSIIEEETGQHLMIDLDDEDTIPLEDE